MTEIEEQLRLAMRAAVDAVEAMPGPLIAAVRRRHRRRTRLLACLAALIIVAVVVPAVLVGRAVVASPAPGAHPSAPAKRLPKSMTGLPLPPGTDVQLLVPARAGWAAWYSTATGTTTPIAGFPTVPPPDGGGEVTFGRVQGGYVVTALRVRGFCARYDCAGPAYDYYFVADGARVATKIGPGLVIQGVVTSGQAGAVWLTGYPRSSDNVATTSAITQLVSTTGRVLSPPHRLPAGYIPEAGVGRYLLLRQWAGRPTLPPVYLLWDPATRRVVRGIVDAFAASPDQIAWTQGCRGCRLQILNVATDKNVSTSIPAGLQTIWGYNASFSDNGQLLEFRPATVGSSFQTPDGAVDIISTTSSSRPLAVIPALSTSRWLVVHWLAGGPTLLLADGPASGSPPTPPTQIAFWQPGGSPVHVATVAANRGGWLVSSAG